MHFRPTVRVAVKGGDIRDHVLEVPGPGGPAGKRRLLTVQVSQQGRITTTRASTKKIEIDCR